MCTKPINRSLVMAEEERIAVISSSYCSRHNHSTPATVEEMDWCGSDSVGSFDSGLESHGLSEQFVSEDIFDEDAFMDEEVESIDMESSKVALTASTSAFPNQLLIPPLNAMMHDRATGKLMSMKNSCVDPLSKLPGEILCQTLTYLDVASLGRVLQVSQRLNAIGRKDESGWGYHCSSLWKDKIFVPKRALEAKEEKKSMVAFKTSLEDGVRRHEVELRELCYNAETRVGTVWDFRFKESAGGIWTSFDPWHNEQPKCRKLVFLANGSVKELVSDEANPATTKTVTPFLDAPLNRPPMTMKWRFIDSPMDMPSRPRGAIRVRVAGREVPTYICKRSPTGNWGFILESCWGMFASFPLPPKRIRARDARVFRPPRLRLRRTSGGGVVWLNVDYVEDERDDEDVEIETAGSFSDSELLSDEALHVTSRTQWREALLYNYGLTALPEGELARIEFDRIIASFRSPVQSTRTAI